MSNTDLNTIETAASGEADDKDAEPALLEARHWPTLVSFASVAIACFLAAFFGGPTWAVVLVTLTASGIAFARLSVSESRASDQRQNVFLRQQRQTKRWQRRWSELHDQSQQSTTALSKLVDGVIMLSNEGQILLINDAALKLLAPSNASRDEDYLGRTFTEAFRMPETTQAVRATRDGLGAQVVMVEVMDENVVRPIRVRVEQIGKSDESNILVTLRDETETHRVEQMRRDFVANINHEIKTPIAAIKGYVETAELAVNDEDLEAAEHFLSQVQGQCQRLERLVADMMQVARAQSGHKNLCVTVVSLREVVTESLRSIEPIAESKCIDLNDDVGDDAIVLADHDATLAIIVNLISNAIHYSPDGKEVHISSRREDNYWVLSVKDQGVGIAGSEQDRIFERFYRVDRTRTSASGGTGIGLSIVKNLSIAQNGKVRLESAPGEGATFEVLFPIAENDFGSDDREPEKSKIPDNPNART